MTTISCPITLDLLANSALVEKARGFFKPLYTTPYHLPDSLVTSLKPSPTQMNNSGGKIALLPVEKSKSRDPDSYDISKKNDDVSLFRSFQLDAAVTSSTNTFFSSPAVIAAASPGNKSQAIKCGVIPPIACSLTQ